MENYIKENNFLARWIAGELSVEELERFKKSKDYPLFKRINDTSQNLMGPEYNAQKILDQLNAQNASTKKKKPKVVNLIPVWAYAAAIVLAFGVFYVLTMKSNYETGFGEQLAVTLPDYSTVKLNAKTKLYYKALNWKSNKELFLQGEAFFDVEKGESFKVYTNEGIVEVLGTEFNVISRTGYFEVQCTEGKVRVTSNLLKDEIILLPGKGVRVLNNNFETWEFSENESNWTSGESVFVNTPIFNVLNALENQYDIQFDTSNIDSYKRFTGAFTNKDLKLALKTVIAPMGLTYQIDKDTKRIVLSPR
ncbi:FecR family protein [Gaetbulibacter saemankumensis]|uniref:FecR family protein n=1 Tax=Gaetbulibacter saemankumensis TaxID=311208 RepID=UPI00040F9B7E|nr:FecR family protein [Gaetbulibacter saemankumensis]